MTSPTTRSTGRGQAATLVLAGTLTIMAGATVAPAIPGIREAFADTPNADLLARMITTTHALAIVLFSPVAGFVVERLGRKRALVAGMLAFGIGGSSGAYLPDLTSMLVGRAVLGIGVSLIMTSSMAMIADLYEGTDRQRLLGRQAAAGSFGGVVLLLGGGALAGLDWRVVFLIYLLGALLVIPALAFLPKGRTAPPAAPEAKGAAAPARPKVPAGILAALAAMMLGQVAFYSVPVQVPFLVEDHFEAAAVVSGAVMAVQTFTTGMVAMRFAFFRRLAGEYSLAALSFLAIGLGYLVLAVAPNVAVLVVALLIMGTGLGFLMPNLNNWVLAEAPAQVRARYAGLLTTALFLGQFLAPILTQPLVSSLGIQPTFAVVAGAALLVAVAYYLGGRRVAGRERDAAGAPAAAAGPEADPAADTASDRRARKAAERYEVQELVDRHLLALESAVRTGRTGEETRSAADRHRDVFTADVRIGYPDGTERGAEGLDTFHEEARRYWGAVREVNAEYAIDLLDQDRAVVRVHQIVTHAPGTGGADAELDVIGHYEGQALRTAEGWRFTRLTVRAVEPATTEHATS
ncbi:MFS transporter [Streptomyces sp. NPDC058701]|uniref:MFS transporter n=1 Tax=Streptomyces sp. NPDC058701 TaxID=3346608 RepID=UPI0036503A29